MQKKLIALAVAGLVSTGAYAQTAVTVYGVADLSFDTVKTSGGTVAGTQTGSYTRVSSNNSLIGFKGSEDLGNGLKALFQFETDVNADNGGLFTGASKRDTFVGLDGAFGTVKLGTLTTPTRALGTAIDVNAGATGIGKNAALMGLAGFDARQDNTVLYSSPSFAGLSLAAAYISGENKTIDNANLVNAQQNRRAWDLGATYNNGPILVGLTYAQDKARDFADDQVKNLRIAGAYDFGVATVRALWNQAKFEDNAGTDAKVNTWGLGGTFNVTPSGKIVAQYYKAGDVKANGNSQADTGAKHYELGYEHSLSKRTLVKVIYARVDNEAAATYNFANNGVRNVAGNNGVDPSGLQFGLRHSF